MVGFLMRCKYVGRIFVAFILALWAGIVGAGFIGLLLYANRPSPQGARCDSWPDASQILTDPDRLTLVVFIHPRCPCSRATLDELEKLSARLGHQVKIHVLFPRPESTPADWERTGHWKFASSIPDVTVQVDVGGVEAKRFGAKASGQVLLFDRAKRLRFRGGITIARGHAGEAAGSIAILSFVRSGAASRDECPVFGCALLDLAMQSNEGSEPCCK